MPVGLDQVLAFFYRPEGRIGRAEFAHGVILVYALGLAILFFLLAHTSFESTAVTFGVLASLPLTVGLMVLVAKRCHDIGLPGSWVLLLFVPMMGVVWLVALLFWPGAPGPNAYGPAPRFVPD